AHEVSISSWGQQNHILDVISLDPSSFSQMSMAFIFMLRLNNLNELPSHNHRCALFSNHDRRCLGITAGQFRHDGCIDYPQTFDTMDSQLSIDDGHIIMAHFARANGM